MEITAGGVLDFLLKETEQLHGKIRRFTSPDEHPFFPDDVPPITLRPITYASVIPQTAPCISMSHEHALQLLSSPLFYDASSASCKPL